MPGLRKRTVVVAAAAGLSLLASGCAGWGGGPGGGGPNSINVLMVNNPQMVDLQKLTAANFTKETGINVNFTVLPENDVRDKISQEFSSQAGQYDVASRNPLASTWACQSLLNHVPPNVLTTVVSGAKT